MAPQSTPPRARGPAIVAVAASAGGIDALGHLLSGLPADFRVPVVVVQHLDPHHRSQLAGILGRRTPLAVRLADDGDLLEPGTAYIAPPDRHLLVDADGIQYLELDVVPPPYSGKGELETACEELQSTNEELQAANEEMETISEELHAAIDRSGMIIRMLCKPRAVGPDGGGMEDPCRWKRY